MSVKKDFEAYERTHTAQRKQRTLPSSSNSGQAVETTVIGPAPLSRVRMDTE